jgi:AcrR family transcriptional regulator
MEHPTRETLLQAGVRLAEHHGLAHMSINAIVREAGVAKGTFYVHFANRTAYLGALHQWFHDRLKARIVSAIADLPPGRERLHRGALTYLDACLQERAVKALLLEARSEPAISAEIQRRNADFALLASADFRAMDWPDLEASARLYVAMVAEAALVELEIGGQNPAVRNALLHFIGGASSAGR